MATKPPGSRSGEGADSVLRHLDLNVHLPREANGLPRSGKADRALYTILVVDDHEPARYVAVKMLEHAGYRTLATDSGVSCLALASQASAVLLDVNLPDLNGVEVCRLLKSKRRGATIPVVLTSAVFVDRLHRDAGLSEGADAYLIAPLDPAVLIALMDHLLGLA